MSSYLSKREQQIMELLFARGEATANEVLEGLPDPISNATARTLLRILEEKGQVTHDVVEGRFVYRPAVAADVAGRGALSKLVDTFFKGSVRSMVATLIDTEGRPLSEEELSELQDLIEKARRKGEERAEGSL